MPRIERLSLSGVETPLAERQALARELAAERGIKYKSALRSVQRYTTTAGQRRSAPKQVAERLVPPQVLEQNADLEYVLIYQYDGELDEGFRAFDAYANYRNRADAVSTGEEALGRQDESFVLLLAEAHFRAPGTPYQQWNRYTAVNEEHTTPSGGAWVLHLRWATKSESTKARPRGKRSR